MKKRVVSSFLGLLVMAAPSVYAADVTISGYASFKATYADNDENVSYLNNLANTNSIDYDTRDNHLGVQLNAPVSDKMDMTVVLSAEGGSSSQYNIVTEWAYGNYQLNPDWAIRVGKVKGPFYMVSDYRDVGYAYPWVRPPTEVYATNPMKALTGVDLIFQKTIGNFNYLLEVYAGSGNHKGTVLANGVDSGTAYPTGTQKGAEIAFNTHGMVGFNATIGTDAVTLRAGYFTTKVDVAGFGLQNEEGDFGGLGLIVDWNNLVIYSEYIIRDTSPNLAGAFPDQNAWYATFGYRINKFLPYVTVAELDEGNDPAALAMKQSSVALGVRYEVDDAAALKFEVMDAEPEADGVGRYGLFDNPIADSGRIYTVSFDVIF